MLLIRHSSFQAQAEKVRFEFDALKSLGVDNRISRLPMELMPQEAYLLAQKLYNEQVRPTTPNWMTPLLKVSRPVKWSVGHAARVYVLRTMSPSDPRFFS